MKALVSSVAVNARKPRPRGAALVLAMLLTALGAAVASQLIAPLSGWLAREYRARDTQASYTLADAAATWSLTVLAGDARTSNIDHLGELWAIALPPTPVEGGTISGQITDLQARFNVNSLAPNGVRSDAQVAVAAALFSRAQVPVSLLERLVDAIDRDDVTLVGQSEAQAYGQRFRNTNLDSLADLLDVGGFTERHVAALAPWFVVLPEATHVNLNTASAELLAAALPNVSAERLQAGLASRATKPITSVTEWLSSMGAANVAAAFSTDTQFFETIAVIDFDRVKHQITLRAQRKKGFPTAIYYRVIRNA
jgi:general secretion pathway protein K